jgi:stage II sporulation protein D
VPITVRVLLREDFRHLEVSGSRRAPLVRVNVLQTGLEVINSDGAERLAVNEGSGLRLLPEDGSLLELDSRQYHGWMDIFINPVGVPVAVNEVKIEEYLKGVVPNELSPALFPFVEAQKAQSVAARTFAIRNLGNFARFGYDLYGDERSQSYAGMEREHPLCSRGVDETKGVIATYQGDPIWAFYCSTCGGRSEAYHLVFKGEPIEYLRGGAPCHDEKSPYHRWERWIDIRRVQSDLDRYANVGSLKELIPLARSETGRIIEMSFVGDRGRKVLRGNDVRFALGLPSSLILEMEPVLDLGGYVQKLHVQGRGWGHGVGMCQVGAADLAEKGQSYDQILRHYYPGIEVTQWY